MQFQQNQKIQITGGTVTISAGTVSISGTPTIQQIIDNVNVNAPVDQILNTNNLFTSAVAFNSGALHPTTGVEQFVVALTITSGGGQFTIQISNGTSGLQSQCNVYFPASHGFVQVPIACAADPGDTIVVTVSPTGSNTFPCQMNILAVGLGTGLAIQTQPGTPIEVAELGGIQKVSATIPGVGTVNIIGAPPGGVVYAIKRVVFGAIQPACTQAKVSGHTSNVRVSNLQIPTQAGITFTGEDCAGLIMNEALDLVTGGGGCTVDIHYDLVSFPTIQ